MNPRKIALVVDSGTDVPEAFAQEQGIYMIPITIIYSDREYRDKVDISAQEVYDNLTIEVPRTSLPSADSISKVFGSIRDEGIRQAVVITISAGLSGTNNLMHLVAKDFLDLDIRIIDTKNIGFGAGTQAMLAAELIANGMDLDSVCQTLEANTKNTHIFFCLSTLEYLARGGRIGKVAALVGSLLNLKPIITCNEEGVYTTASKVRGRAKAVAETMRLAVQEATKHVKVRVGVVQGNAMEEAKAALEELKRLLPNCSHFVLTDVSPALVVHTGPGLLGISVQALP